MLRRQDFIKNLQKQTAHYFESKGYEVDQTNKYILANRDDWQKNIIIPEVAVYIAEQKKNREHTKRPFPLHKWIHHGLSSQACLFGLLGEFVADKDYFPLKQLISLSEPVIELKGNIVDAEFEYEDRSIFEENKGQPTSIDLYVKTDKDDKVFVEFKFTEAEFGTCSVYENGDCDGQNPKNSLNLCYLHQLGMNYMKLMNKYNLLLDTEHCPYTEFYQAYRLLLFALENKGSLLLIHDERNPAFLTKLNSAIRGKFYRFVRLLPKEISASMSILSIQRIVHYLEQSQKYSWLEEFREKYL